MSMGTMIERSAARRQLAANTRYGGMSARRGLDGRLHVYATNNNDRVYVMGRPDGRVVVKVNDEEMVLTREQAKKLTIHTGGGNDRIVIGSDVPKGVVVDAGRGNDRIANFGHGARIYGGSGNDRIENYGHGAVIHGNRGNDAIVNHGQFSRVYGDRGRDTIVNTGRRAYINGGSGRDAIVQYGRQGYVTGGFGSDVIVSGGYDNRIVDPFGRNVTVDSSGYNSVHTSGRKYRRGIFGFFHRLFGPLADLILAPQRRAPASVRRAYDQVEQRIEEQGRLKEWGFRMEAGEDCIYD